MKKLLITSATATALAASSQAALIDLWEFSESNGTGLSGALSNTGNNLGNDATLVSVQNGTLEFSSDWDGSSGTASTFRTTDLSTDPITSGIVQVSWTVTSASFVNTEAVGGAGRVGFELRDTDPSNNNFATVKLNYLGASNEFALDYGDGQAVIASGTSLSDLNVRYVADLDNAGNAGSYRVYYSFGAGPETALITDGILDAGVQIDDFRTVQQVTNGGTDWRAGDTVYIDNLRVESIPEPSSTALIGLAGLGFILRRRR